MPQERKLQKLQQKMTKLCIEKTTIFGFFRQNRETSNNFSLVLHLSTSTQKYDATGKSTKTAQNLGKKSNENELNFGNDTKLKTLYKIEI